MEMKKILFALASISFLILVLNLNLVAAERYENNYFKYGIIKADGSLQKTSTNVNDVNVLGVICSSAGCNSVSGYLYNENILTSSGNFIQLTYPTVLASSFGYGIYMVKNGYIPYELNANYWGTNPADPQGPYNDYLTRKEICKSDVAELHADENFGIISADAKISSSITNAGPLNFIPEQIKSYYTADTKVIFEIRKNDELIYSEDKTINIEFSGNKVVSFSSPELDAGTYNVSITSVSNDAKCLSSLNKQASKIITIETEPECTQNSDCGSESYSENYCKNDNVVRNHIVPACAFGKCVFTNITETVQVCTDGCSNGACILLIECCSDSQCGIDGFIGDNFCEGKSVFRNFKTFTCLNPGTAQSSCSSSTTKQLIQTCEDSCSNGECVNQTIVCSADSDCGTAYCNNPFNFCKDNDIFQEFTFFKCNNPGTVNSFCSNFTAPQLILDCGDNSCDNFGDNYCKNDNVHRSRTCYERGCRDNSCFVDSSVEEQLVKCCTNGCLNGVCINETISFPIVNLIAPINNTNTTNPVNFTYTVTSDSVISDCNLIIDGSTRLTSSSISSNTTNSFEYSPSIGTHNWIVSCTNAFDKTNVSETRVLVISQSGSCTTDSQCGSDFYSNKYCSGDSVYKDRHDFSCVNGSCVENTTKELVEECEYGCSNGGCEEKDNEDDRDDDRIDRDKRIEVLEDDILFASIPSANYSSLGVIDLTTKTSDSKVSKKLPFWIWILIFILIILLIIVLLLTARKK